MSFVFFQHIIKLNDSYEWDTQLNSSNTNTHTQTQITPCVCVWTFSGTWILTFLHIALFIVLKTSHWTRPKRQQIFISYKNCKMFKCLHSNVSSSVCVCSFVCFFSICLVSICYAIIKWLGDRCSIDFFAAW